MLSALPLPAGRLAPGHTLVTSNEHAVGVQDVSPAGLQETARLVQRVAQNMAAVIGATGLGLNVLNASGTHSDHSVDHLHFHVVPRWADDQLETWPRGRSSHVLDDGWLNELLVRLAE